MGSFVNKEKHPTQPTPSSPEHPDTHPDTQPDTQPETKPRPAGEKKQTPVHFSKFEDTRAKAEAAVNDIELNFEKYYNAARQSAKEYEELALMVKKVFGLNPYIPEEDRIQTMLYRLGAPELLEAYRECVRAAEIDRRGAVTEDYCNQLKWDRIKQAVDRIDKEIDQIISRTGMNDVMLLGLNGVAECL